MLLEPQRALHKNPPASRAEILWVFSAARDVQAFGTVSYGRSSIAIISLKSSKMF